MPKNKPMEIEKVKAIIIELIVMYVSKPPMDGMILDIETPSKIPVTPPVRLTITDSSKN